MFYKIENPNGVKLYQICNDSAILKNSKISEQIKLSEFLELKPIQIKKQVFHKLLNEYFNTLDIRWEFDGKKFKKLPNFENLAEFFEFQKLASSKPFVVMSKGSLYRIKFTNFDERVFTYSPRNLKISGYSTIQLFDFKTLKFVGYTNVKNCAPVFNITDKIVL
jgi:hypothetical protein